MNGAQLRARRRRIIVELANLEKNIAKEIRRILEDRGMSQMEAAALTGEAPSQISLIVTGKLRGFSLKRLIRVRALLGSEVTLTFTSSTTPDVTVVFN